MFFRKVDREIPRLIFVLVCIFAKPVFPYEPPDPTFEVLKPQGLRVSIPDAPNLRVFGFHANANKGIRLFKTGEITGDVYLARNGRWTFEDSGVTIRNGDVLHYWIYVQVARKNYNKLKNWTYSLENEESNEEITEQQSSTTRYEGRLMLEDNFRTLNTSLWKREIKMPLDPDYEFCVYHNENHQELVKITGGNLLIKPLILEDYYGENATAYGRLQLNECTSSIAEECSRQAISYSILPPIISARITTKKSFTFRYGKIEIRARFPQGDWIYPEMWLEPKYSTYGMNYASGRVLLGLTRGNEHLVNATDVSKIYDSRRLDFGIRVGPSYPENIQEVLVSAIHDFGPRWTEDFHKYTTIWNSDGFAFFVDDVEVGTVRKDKLQDTWSSDSDTTKAPFDQEFYITLGVGVGGVRTFPDNTMSSGWAKPWKNRGAKAMLNFWNSRNQWLPSWENRDKTAFVIDYVRVWAL
nr:PREDICTED: beta-1,3-glucan-binding protein-like [Linepithema humile]